MSSPRVSFASLTPNNLGTVRKLNSVLFPIRYSENFYQTILLPELEDFCKLVYYNDVAVGTICCRIENKDGHKKLYLMTMGILAPYRSRNVGSQSLEHILHAAVNNAEVTHVYLHVQVSNVAAKRFYERHGFKTVATQEHYYKKIVPHDAWVLEVSITDIKKAEGQ